MSLENLTSKQRAVTVSRAALVRQYLDSGVSAAEFLSLHSEYSISAGTLYRWKNQYRTNGINGLTPGYNPQRGSRLLTVHDKNILETLYLHQNQWSIAKCVRHAQAAGMSASYDTAKRYLASLPPAVVLRMREGRKKYNDKIQPYLERDYEALQAMELVCMDHHQLDFLVTDGTRQYRPWLTAAQDVRSRKIVAFEITEQPNELTIASVVYSLVQEYGIPQKLLIDNGKDFTSNLLSGFWSSRHSQEVQGIFASLGCEVTFATPYRGQSKPIERWFRTVAEEFSKTMETYVGSNTATRPEDAKLYFRAIQQQQKQENYCCLEEAAKELKGFIHWWNANWHHRGRGMDGRTPDVVFLNTWQQKTVMPKEWLPFIFARQDSRVVQRNGIRLDGFWYYAPELAYYKRRRMQIYRPIYDMSYIYVRGIDGAILCRAYAEERLLNGISEDFIRGLKRVQTQRKEEYSHVHQHLKDTPYMLRLHLIAQAAEQQRDNEVVLPDPSAVELVMPGDVLPASDEYRPVSAGDERQNKNNRHRKLFASNI